MTPRHRNSYVRGLTLVELLISITIIIVLAAIAFTLGKKVVRSANSARDLATMRTVFSTIPMYAGDNNGLLPGPVNTGVKATYGPQSTGRLSYYIASYLGYENPERDEFLPAMGYTWQRDERSMNAPCSYMREDVPLVPGGNKTIKPFGHPLRSGEDRKPKSMAFVLSQIDPARTWAISDIDQQHPDIGNPAWKRDVPEKMSHDTYRLAIYFDGHSGKLNKDNEAR